jgi:hypothetical protein
MKNGKIQRKIKEILQSRFGVRDNIHDYAMYIKPSGAVRDHVYLFRTTREKMKYIFPIERVYDLSIC